MFDFGLYNVLIYAGVLGVQYFFATRNSVYWGALIPVIFVTWRTWILFTSDERVLSYVLILLLGLAFLIGGWIKGRETLKERRKKELDKMRFHDM